MDPGPNVRVFLLTEHFPPKDGGIARWAWWAARTLSDLQHEVVVFATKKCFLRGQPPKGSYRLEVMGWRNWHAFKHLYMFYYSLKARLCHGRGVFLCACWDLGLAPVLFAQLMGCSVVVAAHGLEVTREKGFIHRLLRAYILRRCHAVIAVSRFTAGRVRELIVDGGKIQVIPNGVDADLYRPRRDSAHLRTTLGLQGRRVILTLGRLVERKGVDRVIQAMPQVLGAVPNAHYVVVGEGGIRRRLEAQVRRMGLDAHVSFVGFVPDDELVDWYNLCDVYIMPSRRIGGDVEGFGITFLEANACCKPVIGGNSGGVADAVEDGVSGLLVDPEDPDAIARALIAVLTDEALAKRLGLLGRRRVVSRFDWGIIGGRLHGLLAGLTMPAKGSSGGLVKGWERFLRRQLFHLLSPLSRGRAEGEPLPTALERVLFLRPGKLGDMVAALPTFANAKRIWPDAEVDVMGSPLNAVLLQGNPHVGQVFRYDKVFFNLPGLIWKIRRRRYDMIVDLVAGPSVTNALLSLLFSAGAFRLGLAKGGMSLFYHRIIHLPDELHCIERGLAIFEDFQGKVDYSVDMNLTPQERKYATSFVLSGSLGRPLIGVNFSAGEPSRTWPAEHYRQLLDHLKTLIPSGEFIIFTHPQDRAMGDALRDGPTIRQIPPGSHIRQVAAIVSHLDVLVSPDTSLVHIASAFKVPVVGLYPRGDDNFRRWHPFQVPSECLLSRGDVEEIDPLEVVEATLRLLRRIGHAQKLFSKPRCILPRVKPSPSPSP